MARKNPRYQESTKYGPLGDLTVYVDEDGTSTYVGYAALSSSVSSPVWQIKKIGEAGTLTTVLFADGNNQFDNIWNNRTSLDYF